MIAQMHVSPEAWDKLCLDRAEELNLDEWNELESELYRLRRSTQGDLQEMHPEDRDWCYFASLSSRTIIYKGMVQSEVLCVMRRSRR